MTFYSPWAFLGLITIPIIIILYLLKQKHKEYNVSSLFLWEEVLKDLEANAPWQKLKKNLLMILQIIAALLLVFALARPFLNAVGSDTAHIIVALDTSLSMKATDVRASRFEEAKNRANKLISNLKPGTAVTLISIGKSVNIEENLSSDRGRLLDKLSKLKVSNSTSNIEDAESLISSIIKQNPETRVVVFGDSAINIPSVDVEFSKVSNNGDNFAVTMMSHTKTEKGITVLSRISNYSSKDVTIPVSLYVDKNVFDAKNVDIKKGETANVYWNEVSPNAKLIEARIDIDDSLDIDNSAWNAVNNIKKNKVILVSESNVFIEKITALYNGVELFKAGYESSDEWKGYDLYIFDGFLPKKIPNDGNIMVFNPNENKMFEILETVEAPVIDEMDGSIFRYVEGFDFSIGKTKTLKVPTWGRGILGTNSGSVAFSGTYNNRRVMVFGFDVHNTDIPLTPAFPIIMANSLDWLLPDSINNAENVYSGEGIEFNIGPSTQEAYIQTPSGEKIKIAPPFPVKLFDKTDVPGLYSLRQKTEDSEQEFYFTVNVPSQSESNLAQSEDAENTNTQASAEDGQKPVNTGMNLQSLLLWLIVIVLLIEWWVYTNGV
jgi:hypothetical protein